MSEAIDLLRKLSPISRASSSGASRASASSVGSLDFGQMLSKAQAGDLSSGMTVHATPGCGVELSPAQVARLSAAADRAEAQGATRAVAIIDGQAVHLDVPTRTVLGKADLSAGKTIANIDSVIMVPDETLPPASVKPPPTDVSKLSPSLLQALNASSNKAGENQPS